MGLLDAKRPIPQRWGIWTPQIDRKVDLHCTRNVLQTDHYNNMATSQLEPVGSCSKVRMECARPERLMRSWSKCEWSKSGRAPRSAWDYGREHRFSDIPWHEFKTTSKNAEHSSVDESTPALLLLGPPVACVVALRARSSTSHNSNLEKPRCWSCVSASPNQLVLRPKALRPPIQR